MNSVMVKMYVMTHMQSVVKVSAPVSQAASTWEDSVVSTVNYCGMIGCEVCSCKPGSINMGRICRKYSYLLLHERL